MIGSIVKAIVGIAETFLHMFSSRKGEGRPGSCGNRMQSPRQDQQTRHRGEQMQSFWWVFTAFITLLFFRLRLHGVASLFPK